MDNIDTLEQLLADSSFVLWLRGEATNKQKQYWEEWLHENPNHRQLVRQTKEIIDVVNTEYPVPDAFAELKKLDRSIDHYERRPLTSLRLVNHPYTAVYRKTASRAAAAVLLLVVMVSGIAGYYYNEHMGTSDREVVTNPKVEQYRTDYGEQLTFRLSDGSSIVLNANSTLTFSSQIKKGLNSKVWLEGEAYFNIAHLSGDDRRAFTVHTSDGAIRVLGTQFVVNTFRQKTETVLEKGKISIRLNAPSATEYELSPGELARFKANDNKIAIQEVNPRIYTSWTAGKLVFDNTPMSDVVSRIEHTFGVDVRVRKNLSDASLSGSIKSTNLKVLSAALEEILDAEIHQKGQLLLIGMRITQTE